MWKGGRRLRLRSVRGDETCRRGDPLLLYLAALDIASLPTSSSPGSSRGIRTSSACRCRLKDTSSVGRHWSPSRPLKNQGVASLGGVRTAFWAGIEDPKSHSKVIHNYSKLRTRLNTGVQEAEHTCPSSVIFAQSLHLYTGIEDDFEKPSTYPYFIDGSTKKSAEALLNVSLSRHATKNILLTSPHPGASIFLESTVKAAAKEVKADVLTLDYDTLLRAIHETKATSKDDRKRSIQTRRLDDPSRFSLSEPFSPGLLHVASELRRPDGAFQDNDFIDEEEFDGDEDDEVDHISGPGNSWPPGGYERTDDSAVVNRASRPKRPSVTFELTVGQPKTQASTNAAVTSGQTETPIQISVSTGPAPSEPRTLSSIIKDDYVKGSHYDNVITDVDLRVMLHKLMDFIEDSCGGIPNAPLPHLRSPRCLVIFMKDFTDMAEAGGDTGKRVVLGLLDMVEHVRQKLSIPIVLIGGCSPTLKDTYNIAESTEFFKRVCAEGPRHHGMSLFTEEISKWNEGVFFKTPFDFMSEEFDKVEMLPPMPSMLTADGSITQEVAQEVFAEWLERMHKDTKKRIREINWKRVEAACRRRKITMVGLEASTVAYDDVDRNVVPTVLHETLPMLDKGIWCQTRIERLVSLAIGLRLNMHGAVGPSHTCVDLTAKHFAEALQIMYSGVLNNTGPSPQGGLREPLVYPADTTADVGSDEARSLVEETHDDVLKDLEEQGVKLNAYEKKLASTVVHPETIRVDFGDLVLPQTTKQILQTLVTLPLLRPEYFSKGILSRHFINGVLLFGPPGTGKTMLAKAVAKSSGARFMNVALSNIFDKYVGEGEKNVKAIFTLARKISPCVIFLDEVDAIFGSRRNDTHGARREIINEFMSEWDGLTSNNHGIIVVGATNRPFDLDDAILRRMPRRVLIDLPSEEQRMKILEIHLRDEELDETVDVKNLARTTASYSGSDLKSLCVAAALARVRDTLTQDHSTVGEELSRALNEGGAVSATVIGQVKKNGRRSKRPESSVASLGPLRAEHFNAAMSDVPPSLTDETQTLVELRKWDETYGDAAGRRKGAAKKGWGFYMGGVTESVKQMQTSDSL
ncbi:hypothetical protein HDU85_007280 [Gaertneriomyces sp. JEL0708]|nr:hypothetical protein HDU85_007280 [Gaertneriomyces sp. JEL0708]